MGRNNLANLEQRETMMKTNPLAEDADALLALAESIATVLSEKHEELCISTESEALLRASIAAAAFAIDTYLAVLSGIKKSPAAFAYVAEAKTRCDRNIAQLCRHMSNNDFIKVADYATLISA